MSPEEVNLTSFRNVIVHKKVKRAYPNILQEITDNDSVSRGIKHRRHKVFWGFKAVSGGKSLKMPPSSG